MTYSNFVAEDFCRDAYFIQWATSPNPESERFWRSFTDSHPDKVHEVQLALEYIKMMRFKETEPAEADLAALRERIWNDLYEPSQSVKTFGIWRYVAAASVVFGLFLGSWFIIQNRAPTSYHTDFGQITELILDDGSRVTLNAKSELKVSKDLGKTDVREVWLNGEAFFEIAKRDHSKFVVHTQQTQVEVLGTEFNVNTRRSQTQVVLAAGKVRLVSGQSPALVMKPGEMATVRDKKVQIRSVSPNHYDAWKQFFLVMDDKPVSEIVHVIQESYGIQLRFEDTSLLHKKLSGKLLVKDPDDFLENLSTILQTELIKTQDGYLFR